MSIVTSRRSFAAFLLAGLVAAPVLTATRAPAQVVDGAEDPQEYTPRGTPNIQVVSHLPLGPRLSVADIELEQEMDRPYAYVARMQFGEAGPKGMDIVDLQVPSQPEVIYEWRIENQELHARTGGMDVKYFKWRDRYYVVQSLQFGQGGPDHDLGAVVLDVTGLPDASRVEEVARIRAPETPGGFHNIFIYKHSNDRVYLFATVSGPHANVYDLGTVVEDGPEGALAGQVPVPETSEGTGGSRGYHDFYAGYHPASGQDRFYGGGTGGYFVYDISDLGAPELLTSITGVVGVRWGHTFTPSPDGRYAVGESEYQYQPLRIFDLQPGLDGDVPTIRRPVGAWTANWRHLSHNHEVRWPYVFVSAYEDGMQVFNMQDPENPITVGYYDTYIGPHATGGCSDNLCNGAFGVDVRNADGLIVTSDMVTGFWAFRMEGFQGWDGRGWGMPNISSAQDWEDGPTGGQ
jgi:hypothetical protein